MQICMIDRWKRKNCGGAFGPSHSPSAKLQASSSQLRNQFHTAWVKNILISIWPEWQAGQIAAIAIKSQGAGNFSPSF